MYTDLAWFLNVEWQFILYYLYKYNKYAWIIIDICKENNTFICIMFKYSNNIICKLFNNFKPIAKKCYD